MCRRRLSIRPIRRALELLSQGKHSRREIARICGISRPALAEYQLRAAEAGLTWPLQPEIDDAALETLLFPARKTSTRFPQPDWAEIHRLMRSRKDATLIVLHDEYIAVNPGGMKYATFCKAYRAYARKQKSTMRFDYRPGDVAFVDYAGRTIAVVSEGHTFEAQIFVAVLGSSGLIYAEATQSQKLPDWLGSHQRAFSSWGGTPRTIVCDNLKSAVTLASYKGEPVLQQQYAELACHYGINILPARPRHPQDKASVEKAVQSVGRGVLFSLRNEHFTRLHELNEEIRKLVLRINQKPIRRMKLSREQLFASGEQAALQPLPATKWEYAEYHRRTQLYRRGKSRSAPAPEFIGMAGSGMTSTSRITITARTSETRGKSGNDTIRSRCSPFGLWNAGRASVIGFNWLFGLEYGVGRIDGRGEASRKPSGPEVGEIE